MAILSRLPNAPASSVNPETRVWQKVLRPICLGFAALFYAFSFYLLALVPLIGSSSSTYASASLCSATAPPAANCYRFIPAQVVSLTTIDQQFGLTQHLLNLTQAAYTPKSLSLAIDEPTLTYYQLKTGEAVSLKIWRNSATAVYNAQNASFPTSVNPGEASALPLTGGLLLAALATLILVILPPRFLRPWLNHLPTSPSRRWQFHQGLETYLADRVFRVALLVFIIVQALDVLTSTLANHNGTFEGTPLPAVITLAWGPLLGFIFIKLFAVDALLLIASRLPRLVALTAIWLSSAFFVPTLISNLALALPGPHA